MQKTRFIAYKVVTEILNVSTSVRQWRMVGSGSVHLLSRKSLNLVDFLEPLW